jgi:hypothetical protein
MPVSGQGAQGLKICDSQVTYHTDYVSLDIATDCDDGLSTVYPGATEVCDTLDNDCNLLIDDVGVTNTYYQDSDGDTYGDHMIAQDLACPATGWVADNTDCNDNDFTQTPVSTRYEDIDNDGFGDTNMASSGCVDTGYSLVGGDCDDNDPNVNANAIWWLDSDGDGEGDPSNTDTQCTPATSYVNNSDDCDDDDATINSQTSWYPDTDEDTFGAGTEHVGCSPPPNESYARTDDDCDDTDDTINPQTTWWEDNDGDGLGNPGNSTIGCDPSKWSGTWVDNSDDCDDDDDEVGELQWYTDIDQDSFGIDGSMQSDCTQPADTSDRAGDCDDTDDTVNPDAQELCDSIDNNCNDVTDEPGSIDGTRYFIDADNDEIGLPRINTVASGDGVSCGLDHEGFIHCWDIDGNGGDGDILLGASLPVTGGFVELYMGRTTACGLKGPPGAIELDCWGEDDHNQITDAPSTPGDYIDGGLGDYYGCVLNADRGITCWGVDDNASGQTSGQDFDQVSDAPTDKDYQSLAVGRYGACAIRQSNGQLECWGMGGWTMPTTTYTDVECGVFHCCALTNSGEIDCLGPLTSPVLTTPTTDGWDGLVSGFDFQCAVKDSGEMECWGDLVVNGPSTIEWDHTNISGGDVHFCGTDISGNIHCIAGTGINADDNIPAVDNWADMSYCNEADLPSGDYASASPDCDDQDPNSTTQEEWYLDLDQDSWGDSTQLGGKTLSCVQPDYFAAQDGDCDDNNAGYNPDIDWYQDADGDGYGDLNGSPVNCSPDDPLLDVNNGLDCDDQNWSINPSALEICDQQDNDCDGLFDQDDDTYDDSTNTTWYLDNDGDGYGDPATPEEGCDLLTDGYVRNPDDCDDNLDTIYFGATEICGDSIDQDCDGADLNCSGDDSDGDGFCDGQVCDDGSVPGDCDDTDASISPWASEICDDIDNNCNIYIDEGLTFDEDNDGHTSVGSCAGNATDCNDYNPDVFPGAAEACNGIDDNCDNSIDEGLNIDNDNDGFYTASSCNPGSEIDCDDDDPYVNPLATENVVNGFDDDCDGYNVDPIYIDNDGDGYCEDNTLCEDGSHPGDCDDDNAAWNPEAVDLINGDDEDCDGTPDNPEDSTIAEWSVDHDGDGFSQADGDCNDFEADDGTASIYPTATELCNGFDDNCDGYVLPGEVDGDLDGYMSCENDCDDQDPARNPGALEDCTDGIDNNCNGFTDEDQDVDLDGYTTCKGDCNDGNAQVYTGALELCNGLDDDCDGFIDENFDLDKDGYYDASQCALAHPDELDCDDNNALIYPSALENCTDLLDNNCDGSIDENADLDGDGWDVCDGDCDDNNRWVSPGTGERCNSIDDDCDGLIDEEYDLDGDGITTCTGDCEDGDPSIASGFPELCDGLDNDCSRDPGDDTDLGLPPGEDDDGDGYASIDCCVPDEDSCGSDCDDLDADVNPIAEEVCDDGIDNNCNELTDLNDLGACEWIFDTGLDTGAYIAIAPQGCDGCNASALAAMPTGIWFGLLGLLGIRRRRFQNSSPGTRQTRPR